MGKKWEKNGKKMGRKWEKMNLGKNESCFLATHPKQIDPKAAAFVLSVDAFFHVGMAPRHEISQDGPIQNWGLREIIFPRLMGPEQKEVIVVHRYCVSNSISAQRLEARKRAEGGSVGQREGSLP